MSSPSETPEERRQRLLDLSSGLNPGILGPRQPTKPVWDADLIPQIDKPEISEENRQLDDYLQNFDILQAYRVFIGKMEPDSARRKTEGIMISCPTLHHIDKNPSAWANTDNNLWYCGGCQAGGDIFDLGAIHFGYDLQTYKKNGTFPKLKRQMADKLGFITVRGITGTSYLVPPAPPEPVLPPSQVPEVLEKMGEVRHLTVIPPIDPDDYDAQDKVLLDHADLRIDWETIIPEETYLAEWMKGVTIDDLPHEFYMMLGLQSLAFALGRKTFLSDFKIVRPNLYVCLYGRTGVGKSRAISPLMDILKMALPYDGSDPFADPTGVKIISTPASAEGLIDQFKYDVMDASTMKVVRTASVSGLVKIEELSGFIARASRLGSSLKETIMDMFDVYGGDITLHGRSAGTTRIHDPYAQFLTTTQPKAIHAYLRRTDIESGFLNRILYALGKSRRAPMSYGGSQPDLDKAADMLRDVSQWAHNGKRMILQGPALDVWDNFFHDILAPFKTGEVEMESMASRIDLQLKKLIVLFTGNLKQDHPTPESVTMAIKFYDYLAITYSAFGGDISYNDVTECQNKIIEMIDKYTLKHGEPPTARNIRQNLGKKYDLELLIRALKNLVQLDVVYEDTKQSNRGRPSKRYSLASSGTVTR